MSRLMRKSGEDAASLGSFVFTHANAGFRPRGGKDGFTPGNDSGGPVTAEQERARIQEEAFALGCEEGRKTVEAEFAAERDALGRLAESLAVLRPEPANALALAARRNRRPAGAPGGRRGRDRRQSAARPRQRGRRSWSARMSSRPGCAPIPTTSSISRRASLEVPLHADPTLTRGAIVLETGHGWIEDGPAVRLDRLRAELDKMAAPR